MTAWWSGAVAYEVYVRSFADGDGDGIGDLVGLRSRLPVLAELGVDVVWITPFYPSPLLDGGYDVTDHRDVDRVYGGLPALDAVLADAHELGMRVVVDLVPNHTSSEHPWFRAARSSRDDPHRDLYVWRDPAPDGGPPNNWVSHFGGPAWTYDGATGQYWLHLFLPEQPDLNWAHPRVPDEFAATLTWWLERGVDGFRVDVAHGLVKDPQLRDNPRVLEVDTDADARTAWGAFEHRYDLDQEGAPGVYERWRSIADAYDALLVGEVYLLDPARVARYVREQRGLHSALCIPSVRTRWDARAIATMLRDSLATAAGNLAWVLSSHDDSRAPSRFGGGEEGRRRALAYLTLLAGLPGLLVVYQGDELGLEDVPVPVEHARDPIVVRSGRPAAGRDPVRTPMPWEPAEGFGFTTGEPWLPFGDRRAEDTVARQRGDPRSHWNRTRDLFRVRREVRDLRGPAPVTWLRLGDPVVAYRRGGAVVAANCGADPATLDLGAGFDVLYATAERCGTVGPVVELAPAEALVLRGRP